MITTITTTSAEDAKISTAVGDHLRLGRNATASEVKAELRNYLVNIVLAYDEKKDISLLPRPTPINPT